jgi:ataxia telangiectasia mutated family protein
MYVVQVEKNIFIESNETLRSIQVLLDAMNKLRLCYVLEKEESTLEPSKKRETSKVGT